MLKISRLVEIPDSEIEINAIHASGPGGQNVNKVATAIHLRFDSQASSLPEFYKRRLLNCRDRRINSDGVITIKAQSTRSQELNREDALERLQSLIQSVAVTKKKRIATKPSRNAKMKRLDTKIKRGKIKNLRSKVNLDE